MDSKKKFASVPVIIALCILVVALPVFGCMPNLLMDPIAAMGDHFANSHGMEHAVNYLLSDEPEGCRRIPCNRRNRLLPLCKRLLDEEERARTTGIHRRMAEVAQH